MSGRWRNIVIFLALGVISIAGHAQKLNGVRSVGILVEEVDQDAASCGISKDGIDAAIRIPISNSRLVISNSPPGVPYVYAQVTVLKLGNGGCVGSIPLELNRFVWLAPGARQLESQIAAVWGRSSVVAGLPTNFPRIAGNMIEDMTKLLIAAWLKDN